ncbi:MAG: hypothetical protein JFAIHJKO_00152 [Pyrinomonadaceae bacterium]|nr:hypothetical protein [Pyrinomonadaceae bacterium]
MNSKLWIRRALSTCSMVAIFATYSMVALAATPKASGELLVSGSDDAVVTVDGQSALSGRTIFSGSTIVTSENASAILSCAAAGSIKLAPNSTAVVTFDGSTLTANLNSGSLTVVSSAQPVAVTTPYGVVSINAGETAAASQDSNTTKKKGGSAWIVWGVIFGAAAVALIGTAVLGSDSNFGSGGTVVPGPPTTSSGT